MTNTPLQSLPTAAWFTPLDPRGRILIAIAIALTVSGLQHIPSLLAALALIMTTAFWAALPFRQVARALFLLETAMLILLMSLPFTVPGTALFHIVDFPASIEGFQRGVQIFLRANTIVISMLLLLATLEPTRLAQALQTIGLPDKLTQLLLFTIRYIHLLHDEFTRLRTAMRARAFVAKSNTHTWRSIGWLAGMLFVRSHARVHRVQNAMKCRGFKGHFYRLTQFEWQPRDTLFTLACLMFLCGLFVLDSAL